MVSRRYIQADGSWRFMKKKGKKEEIQFGRAVRGKEHKYSFTGLSN